MIEAAQPQDYSTNKNQFSTSNYHMLADPTFIKLKLDTSELLQRTEVFLSATKTAIERDTDGNLFEKKITVGEPYANDEGVAAIMNMLDMRANNHSVQGNMDRIEFYDFLADARNEISQSIIINCHQWGINDTKLDTIIDTIMGFMRAFISRTIDNKERESLTPSFSSTEFYNANKQKESLFQSFTGGKK